MRFRLANTAVVLSLALASLVTAEPSGALVDAQQFGGGDPFVPAATLVAIAPRPQGDGYWLVARDGAVFAFGDAPNLGGTAGVPLNQPIVAIASMPDGTGYWLVAGDGGVFSFGAARFHGSTGNLALNQPIVGIASTASGNGYWLVAGDGGVFSFGDARFRGSTGGQVLNRPIVGMAATATGKGYWMVASDGGVFTFGDAKFRGSTGDVVLNQPIVGMQASDRDRGYWLVARDGGIFTFGAAPFFGSAGSTCFGTPAIGMASARNVEGYWVAGANGRIAAFSPSAPALPQVVCAPPPPPPPPPDHERDIAMDFFARLNDERAARGLAPLAWDEDLAYRARGWSWDMAANGFRHSDLGPLLGRFSAAAENIAWGGAGATSGQIHVAWMRSDGHRANLLAPNLDAVGIGVYCAPDGQLWATQQFGRFPDSPNPWGWGPTPPVDPVWRWTTDGPRC